MLSEATSGFNSAAGRSRSSTVMYGAPPVVRLMTQSVRCLITFRNGWKASGVWSGLPVSGLRACRWTMAAPASAAPIAASAISSGVTGRCGDMDGVWMAPVTAQVMMTLLDLATAFSPVSLNFTLKISASKRLDVGADAERLARDVAARRRRQEQHHGGDIVGAHHPAQRGLGEIFLLHLGIADADLIGSGADHLLDPRPGDDPRQHRIDRNP